jgi:hypothetical protein
MLHEVHGAGAKVKFLTAVVAKSAIKCSRTRRELYAIRADTVRNAMSCNDNNICFRAT